jgi:Txe/YoeB family toxin of Txe-Axe toxin-antitoxin module
VSWRILYTKQAQEDAKRLASAGLKEKAQGLLRVPEDDPFQSPPPYEKLVKVLRMWTQYDRTSGGDNRRFARLAAPKYQRPQRALHAYEIRRAAARAPGSRLRERPNRGRVAFLPAPATRGGLGSHGVLSLSIYRRYRRLKLASNAETVAADMMSSAAMGLGTNVVAVAGALPTVW